MASYRIVLDIEGATEEDLARGVAAAQAVFEDAAVDPWDGAHASHDMEWRTNDSTVVLTDEEVRCGKTYWNAIETALQAACENLPNTAKKYEFSLLRPDEASNQINELSVDVVRPSTAYGRPAEELSEPKSCMRRKLVGWNWEWSLEN
jgi:hypothetical protein